ncbi:MULTISPECIES: cobalamin biosynthesis protein [unclassified Mesorhizobium]|uniref:cobalamin biosynthesis protein n=1 Tax=unclassified Mesorhizobium TaxID=325217 RepID=UPI000FCBED9E|nr:MULTISPECIES: cobalamin biosynthesis protein [unclassified Mesorhizobium]TGP23268.1 cobalamin biosynthesis protein [Mesorhizobium sp. M1D.F.Ca.ET.231.01.1.1]TGP32330.1 cobalamin biosynthesis protein [Mesorhizobium sp. M1D.F.Ca.ET.234.01.1.1]TGS46794.1 cobalamin biosynthesis protein [Mesorhizobium sp. M1D.F.Ca.ET.184.01.1.1]TGS61620.1 cobalamin biosynthesis protein [Mesorhizobium sp. M1D.F.Ca.ET.183.01.1.1]
MMIAGIGSRKGVTPRDVRAAIETALEAHGLAMTALSALATGEIKRDEEAIFLAGRDLALPVIVVTDDALQVAASGTISLSELSQAHAGIPSVSEASALAAAGKDAKLLGPRTVLGPVTCAIALGGGAE